VFRLGLVRTGCQVRSDLVTSGYVMPGYVRLF
jgi:hypothetical protein